MRTFLDSGVLIAAYKGQSPLEEPALRILKDPKRLFLSSPFVVHEVAPKALYNGQRGEYRFYKKYFKRCMMEEDLSLILQHASRESARSGVGAMDSLHLAAAHLLRADEFVTTKNPADPSIARSSSRSSTCTAASSHHRDVYHFAFPQRGSVAGFLPALRLCGEKSESVRY